MERLRSVPCGHPEGSATVAAVFRPVRIMRLTKMPQSVYRHSKRPWHHELDMASDRACSRGDFLQGNLVLIHGLGA